MSSLTLRARRLSTQSNQWILALVILVVFCFGEAIKMSVFEQFVVDLHNKSLLGVPFTKCTGTDKYAVTVEGTSDPIVISGLEVLSPTTITLRSSNSTTTQISLVCVSHSEHMMGTAELSVTVEDFTPKDNAGSPDDTTKRVTSEESSSIGASTVATNADVTSTSTGASDVPSVGDTSSTTTSSLTEAPPTTIEAASSEPTTISPASTSAIASPTTSNTKTNPPFEVTTPSQPPFRQRRDGESVFVFMIFVVCVGLLIYLLRDKCLALIRSRRGNGGRPYSPVTTAEMTQLREGDVQSRTNVVSPSPPTLKNSDWDVSEDKWQ